MMEKNQPKKKTAWTPKRRKKCLFCVDRGKEINYKEIDVLRRYISERGKILHRRITKSCAKHQRALNKAIKSARNLALLPYTVE